MKQWKHKDWTKKNWVHCLCLHFNRKTPNKSYISMFARIKVSILLFLKVSLVKISIDLLNLRTEGIFSVFAAAELFGSIKIVYLVLIKSWGMFQKSFLIFVPVHTLNRPVWDLPLPWALTHIAQFELHGQAEFFLMFNLN